MFVEIKNKQQNTLSRKDYRSFYGLPNVNFNSGLKQTNLKSGNSIDKNEQQTDRFTENIMQTENLNFRMNRYGDIPVFNMMCKQCGNAEIPRLQNLGKEEIMQPGLKSDMKMAPVNFSSQINSVNENGKSLPAKTNKIMSNAFGTDFSNVLIHTGIKAAKLNEQIGARAFTYKNNIYFNEGEFNPGTADGKRLLAHELAHTVQQDGGIQPMIQKDGEEALPESEGSETPFADLLSGLVRNQLSNSGMQRHLRSLGTELQRLAVESTTTEGDQPALTTERLAALGVSRAFEITSAAILRDPDFAALRQRIVDIIGSSDEVALIAALAGAIAAVLADVPLRGSPTHDFGAGFSVGGSFDFGSIQSLQFNNMQLYAQYARDYFRTRIGGSVGRDAETGEFSGSGTGEVRIGNDISHIFGRVTINSDGEVVLAGQLSSGFQFGGSDRLIFTTDLTHTFASGETIVQPGMSGRFNLGHDQSLTLGSSLSISSDTGLTGFTGFIEYRRDFLQLRIEGSMSGLPEESGMLPGGDMRVQGILTIPFF
jgi:hypothetical protein